MKSLSKKIFLTLFTGIIIIVFGAWGMGDLFSGGNKNIIATVDNKKIFVQDFITNARLLLQQKQKFGVFKLADFLRTLDLYQDNNNTADVLGVTNAFIQTLEGYENDNPEILLITDWESDI